MRQLVMITGSSGLIGGAAAKRLAARYDVIGLDRSPPDRVAPMREHVHADFTKDDSVDTALRYVRTAYGAELACVVHLAAYYDFSGEPRSTVVPRRSVASSSTAERSPDVSDVAENDSGERTKSCSPMT